MSFKFIIITQTGIPIFEYPYGSNEGNTLDFNSVLFSGLMTAINQYSVEVTGEIIGDMNMGALQTTFSKDFFNNLYVIVSDKDIPTETLKQIHIEIKSLFLNAINQLGVSIDPEKIYPERFYIESEKIEPVFNPFYKLWTKRIANRFNGNCKTAAS